jgi:hypothetical protein
MSVEPNLYTEIEFLWVQEHEVGGVRVAVGRLTQENKFGPVVFAAALNEFDLRHRARAFGTTTAMAVAALFNIMH